MLTNKYLTVTFATNAVHNSKYVIVPKIISHSPKSEGKKWADEMLLEIFTSTPSQAELNNGNMGIQLVTYHKRLPTINGNNTISLDPSTKVSIYRDSDEIKTNYIPNNAILQPAPQTVIKNIGHGASAEQILQAVIMDNGNLSHLNNKINVVWKSPGQRRRNNSTQLDRYIIQHILGTNLTLTIGPHILSSKSTKGRHRHGDPKIPQQAKITYAQRDSRHHKRGQRRQKQQQSGARPAEPIKTIGDGGSSRTTRKPSQGHRSNSDEHQDGRRHYRLSGKYSGRKATANETHTKALIEQVDTHAK